ncbi:MAG: hypothetical protein VXV81_04845 [Candidatus Thermoplasmatota archaeon]|nr:hypothetical protein [Candidatus Thermoplasmatota archaeon]MEE3038410.1 hypothetical protein [Candidatus Thermoplasmatota archaeon]
MKGWYPEKYLFDTNNLIRALFDENTAEGQLLDAANAGYIELFARSKSWNAVLWLIMNTIVENGKPLYSGEELGRIKDSLPIVWK